MADIKYVNHVLQSLKTDVEYLVDYILGIDQNSEMDSEVVEEDNIHQEATTSTPSNGTVVEEGIRNKDDKSLVDNFNKVISQVKIVQRKTSEPDFIEAVLKKKISTNHFGKNDVILPNQFHSTELKRKDDSNSTSDEAAFHDLSNTLNQSLKSLFKIPIVEKASGGLDDPSILSPNLNARLIDCRDFFNNQIKDKKEVEAKSGALMKSLTNFDLGESKFIGEPSRIPFNVDFSNISKINTSKSVSSRNGS